ncbi:MULTISPECIES: hypothetical protein [Methylomonas]|uniref:P/Homo B domain-containing protein n=1 Tax=Methylomonas koyamae TaxID=702114 RepID=A0A177NWI8_9GAMM|nr:hypothetical protein [Methylomonas koyamae]OAI22365.1 hypothetical protein A1355_22540 [Methylomonas koyamae]
MKNSGSKRLNLAVLKPLVGAVALLSMLPASMAMADGVTRTFANPRPIVIQDTCADPENADCAALLDVYGVPGAPAVPVKVAKTYPSMINVPNGAFPKGTKITDVNVTIKNINHDYLNDVDMLLVAPNGQYVMLASNVSAAGATPEGGVLGIVAENLNWKFDDSAALPLPRTVRNDGRLSSRTTNALYNVIYDEWVNVWSDTSLRTFKPTDYDNNPDSDYFPAPAPAELNDPSTSVALTPTTVLAAPTVGDPSTYKKVTNGPKLSNLNGIDPSGQWKLYVVDDFYWFAGEIKGGWSLEITTDDQQSCSVE